MNLTDLVRKTMLGAAVALGSFYSTGCSSTKPQETIEVKAQQDTSNQEGKAFENTSKEITVVSNTDVPLAGAAVNLYEIVSRGDVYLAKTAAEEGGIAVFPGSTRQSVSGKHRSALAATRKLTIRPAEQTFSFEEGEMIFDLLRWHAAQEYSCVGTYTTEELVAGREKTVRLVSFFDPSGLVDFFYDTMDYAVKRGWVDDFPAGKEWYVLNPASPVGFPLMIQKDLAEKLFEEEPGTYRQLKDACRPKEMPTNGGNCFTAGCPEENCVFYDGFEGTELDECRWEVQGGGLKPQVEKGYVVIGNGFIITKTNGADYRCSLLTTKIRVRNLEGDQGEDNLMRLDGDLWLDRWENTVSIGCGSSQQYSESVELNLQEWNNFKIEVDDKEGRLFKNNEFVGSTPCMGIWPLWIQLYGRADLQYDSILQTCERL